MILILLGLVLWAGAHFFKRLAPGIAGGMSEGARKGGVAVASVLAIVLMVIGYRAAYGTVYWSVNPALRGINNLLVLFAFYLYAASGAKTRITRVIRHPQLTAVIVWAVAHLLVNGNSESFLLFGGLLAWAAAEIVVLNRAQPEWTPAHEVPIRKEITAVVAAIVAVGVVGAIHTWLGYNPFG